MRWLVVLTLAVAASHAQFVFPDEWETLKNQDAQAGGLVLPDFEPTDGSSFNDVQGPAYPDNGGFQSIPSVQGVQQEQSSAHRFPSVQSVQEEQSSAPQVPPQASVPSSKPSSSPFATFLPPQWRDHVLNIISRGTTQFTLDMDHAIDNSSVALSNENVVFSPVSLTVTLAMVLLASGGVTFEEVAKILGLESGVDISHHSEIVHQIFGLLLQESESQQLLDPTLPQAKFAFGLFVQDSYPIREEFRAVSEKVYKSEVISVDFAHRSHEAQSLINNWVSERTNGKIQNMLSDAPNPLTDIIITSALYFSGEWTKHFAEGGTRRQEFTIEPDQKVYVDMMANGGDFLFYEDKELGLKIIGLPYKGDEVTMYAVLPSAPGRAALRELKSKLTPEVLEGLISNMVNSSCLVAFPRMKLSSTLKLQGALESLGLGSLFDPLRADLSVLSPGRYGAAEPPAPPPAASLKHPPPARPGYHTHTSDGCKVEQWSSGFKIERQRPVDQDFVDFLDSQQLPNFGVDDLRNSARLSNPGLYADDVIHRVEMTVNERGTEAAAATSVILDRSGDFRRFRANRPFLFFIRHDPSRIIWFWGNINRPTPFFNSM